MSVRVFRWILVITNLILILIPISALVLSYFFLVPKALDAEIDRATVTLSAAFTIWSIVLILTSICFLGITFTNSCCLHLISALLLSASAALASWLVTEQFLYKETPNWTIVSISAIAAFIWAIQVMTELLLSCILCCSPSASTKDGQDAEAAKKAEAEKKADGTDEEKEKLVLYQHNESHNNSSHGNSHGHGQTTGPGGAFVPSPQAPPIEEVDEDGDEDDDDEEEEDEEEADSQAGIRMIDRNNPNHPHDLALRSIPEEKQHLLHGIGSSSSGLRPMSRSSQGSGGQQCPLATPEDTGV